MNIKLIYTQNDKEKDFNIKFFDDEIKEIVGHCNYYIKNNTGYIYNTYLFPEYRNKKIMKSHINDILIHMKSMGIQKVELSTLSNEASLIWEKLGFKNINKNNMEMDISCKSFT